LRTNQPRRLVAVCILEHASCIPRYDRVMTPAVFVQGFVVFDPLHSSDRNHDEFSCGYYRMTLLINCAMAI
ncbi:unnamed protein product, partial [Ascophyllum nodosum]